MCFALWIGDPVIAWRSRCSETGRHEVHIRFPGLWQKRALQEVRLTPLGRGPAERFVRDAIGATHDSAIIRTVVDRAGGNPFHLEELVRAVVSGRGTDTFPDSVLGMVQARLLLLELATRRVLRAASVYCETFWPGALAPLIGDGVLAHEIQSALAELVAEELLVRRGTSRVAERSRSRHLWRTISVTLSRNARAPTDPISSAHPRPPLRGADDGEPRPSRQLHAGLERPFEL